MGKSVKLFDTIPNVFASTERPPLAISPRQTDNTHCVSHQRFRFISFVFLSGAKRAEPTRRVLLVNV